MTKRKCLIITPRVPYPPNDGGAIRMYNILENLAKYYALDLATFDSGNNEENIRHLKRRCENVFTVKLNNTRARSLLLFLKSKLTKAPYIYLRYSSKEMEKLLKRLSAGNKYDVIFFNNIHTAQFCSSINKTFMAVDLHNNDSVIAQRWADHQSNPIKKKLGEFQAEYIRGSLKRILPQMNVIITVSEKEKNQLAPFSPNSAFIVAQNGVNLEYYSPERVIEKSRSLLFTGDMAWWPNIDASFFFLDDIFPLILKKIPGLKAFLAGRRPPKKLISRNCENVKITGFVEDIRPYFNKASVFIVPLRIGGGTRLKILEAFAMRIPVVSTSIGCEGLEVENGRHLLIRDNPQDFADAVIDILSNPALSESLAKEGNNLALKRYDWNAIMKDLTEQLNQLL